MKSDTDLLRLSVAFAAVGWSLLCLMRNDPVAFVYGLLVAMVVYLLFRPYADR